MIIAETPRLLLRLLQRADLLAMEDVLADPEVMRYSMGVKTPSEIVAWLDERIADGERDPAVGLFAVVAKATGATIGYCGLMELDVDGIVETELGYRLARRHWGNGYATDAARTIRDHGFDVLERPRLVSLIDPGNERSTRVAEKIGMRFEKDVMLPGYTRPDRLYAIRREGKGAMNHIGILAHSADGAALCFLEMCREAARTLGAHEHPEITLSILPMGPVLDAYDRRDYGAVRAYLARTVHRLAAAGCDFFVCPDNTAHIALEAPGEPLPLPGLHIADIVARRAKADGRRRIGLLGTRWTMESPVYPAAFARAGLAMQTPAPGDRAIVDDVIFGELCQGVVAEPSRAAFVRIIGGLRDAGCDAAALACTEIPLIVTPHTSPLPVLDSTRLLAHAAVAVALGSAPLPIWRGGA